MRTSVAFVVLLSSAVAAAQEAPTPAPAPDAPPEDAPIADEVPECQELATLARSPSKNRALSAQISLARCLADHKTKPLVLCDCEQSVLDINAAIEPSLEMLDNVYAQGDATLQILARHAQAEMLASFATRLLATVPPPRTAAAEELALRDTRMAMLQPLVEPWQTRARAAYAEVDKLARANPKLGKNAAVAAAAKSARDKLAQGVARH